MKRKLLFASITTLTSLGIGAVLWGHDLRAPTSDAKPTLLQPNEILTLDPSTPSNLEDTSLKAKFDEEIAPQTTESRIAGFLDATSTGDKELQARADDPRFRTVDFIGNGVGAHLRRNLAQSALGQLERATTLSAAENEQIAALFQDRIVEGQELQGTERALWLAQLVAPIIGSERSSAFQQLVTAEIDQARTQQLERSIERLAYLELSEGQRRDAYVILRDLQTQSVESPAKRDAASEEMLYSSMQRLLTPDQFQKFKDTHKPPVRKVTSPLF